MVERGESGDNTSAVHDRFDRYIAAGIHPLPSIPEPDTAPSGQLCEQVVRKQGLQGRIMARDFERQVTELQVRVSILSRFTQLGGPETVRVV